MMERERNPKPRKKKKLMAEANKANKPVVEESMAQQPLAASSTVNENSANEQPPVTSPPVASATVTSTAASESNCGNLTNEQYDKKDIFIDIEPQAAKTGIVVIDNQIQKAPADLDQTSTDLEQTQKITTESIIETQPTNNSSASISSSSQNMDDQLPEAVKYLRTSNGTDVYLVGTAHFSQKSANDVRRVIQMLKPSAVVLELCKERAFMLTLDEESLLEQNRKLSFEKIRSAIAEKGLAQGLIYIMFIKMSASMTEKLGMAPGSEFRVGAAEAQKIPGCSVILGDRSLKVTVARAVASVSTWQKIKLIYQVLANDVSITQEDVEKCKDKDILEQLLEELGVEFPGFKKVLLDERNTYLAHSIWQWAQREESSVGPVVAIVGIGHVNGIVENWSKTTDEEIISLNELPLKAQPTKTRRFVKYAVYVGIIYIGFRTFVPTSWQDTIQEKLATRLAQIRLR